MSTLIVAFMLAYQNMLSNELLAVEKVYKKTALGFPKAVHSFNHHSPRDVSGYANPTYMAYDAKRSTATIKPPIASNVPKLQRINNFIS